MRKQKKLSIITFNAQGIPSFKTSTQYRLRKTGELLNSIGSDIINLQEVFTYKQLGILKSELGNFPFCIYKKSLIGPGGGLVTFSRIRFAKSFYIPYPYPASILISFIKNGWIRVILRNILTGKGILVSKISKAPIYTINTHLVANPTNNWLPSNKFNQVYRVSVDKLKDLISGLADYKLLILTGDFNIPKNSSFYKLLIKKLSVKDLYGNYNSPTFQKEFLSTGGKGHRLDYILLKPINTNFSIIKKGRLFTKPLVEKRINKGFLSDHIALRATIKLKDIYVK